MGEAKRRGTYEQRKAAAEAKAASNTVLQRAHLRRKGKGVAAALALTALTASLQPPTARIEG